MRNVGVVVGIVLVSLSAAHAAPLAPPPQLIASAAIGDEASISPLAQYANQVKPGVGLMLTGAFLRGKLAAEAGASSTDGLDVAAPMYALGVDDGKGAKGLVVLAKLADEKRATAAVGATFALTKDGWVAFGQKPLVTAVQAYAFKTFPPLPRPTTVAATLYTPSLFAHYKSAIDDAHAKMRATAAALPSDSPFAAKLPGMFDEMFAALHDSTALVVTLEAANGIASVDLAIAPRAGTTLARFAAAQSPSDFAIVGKLAPTSPVFLGAGRFESGPYRDAIIDLTMGFFGATGAAKLRGPTSDIMAAATGELAMVAAFDAATGLRMDQVFALADAKRAERSIGAAVAALRPPLEIDVAKVHSTIRALPDTSHDGAVSHGYEIAWDTSKALPAQQAVLKAMNPTGKQTVAIGVVDGLGYTRSSGGGDAAIDVARGKAPGLRLSGAFADLIATARAHAESFVMILDIGALTALAPGAGAPKLAGPVMMSLGFAHGSTHLRFALPASTIPRAP